MKRARREERRRESRGRGRTQRNGEREKKRKLERYELTPGYDMSTNARLLTSKQKLFEKENENYKFQLAERDILNRQLRELGQLAKKEKWNKNKKN